MILNLFTANYEISRSVFFLLFNYCKSILVLYLQLNIVIFCENLCVFLKIKSWREML